MNKITTFLVTASLLLASCSLIPETTPDTVTVEEVKVGTIEWSLSFPSEWIPPEIEICAKNTETEKSLCTTKHIKDPKYTYGTGYKIEVPAGKYTVTAQLPDSTYRGLYSEFVTCGLKADCPSHALITVLVIGGQTVENIDPTDWYSQQ